MPKYIDGFVIVVPKHKIDDYRKMAEEGKASWLRHGALNYYECLGDDLIPQDMGGTKARSFIEMTGASNEESVWFSFIVFKSKEHRNEVNAKVFADMAEKMKDYKDLQMPFDITRMAYGGFLAQVEN